MDEQGAGERRETVRFVGGPWDGDAGRYYGLDDYPEMATPGGRYCLQRLDHERHEVVYTFRHGDSADLS